MPHKDPNFVIDIINSLKDVLIGLSGGLVAYLLKFSQEKKTDPEISISFTLMIINILIGGYAAYMFGSLIPKDESWRDFGLGVIGVSSYSIMIFIESQGMQLVLKKISDALGFELQIDEKPKNSEKRKK